MVPHCQGLPWQENNFSYDCCRVKPEAQFFGKGRDVLNTYAKGAGFFPFDPVDSRLPFRIMEINLWMDIFSLDPQKLLFGSR